MKYLSQRDFLWLLPLSLALGAVLSALQPGNWFIGWAAFSSLFLLSFSLLAISTRWAANPQSPITNYQSPITNYQSPAPSPADRQPAWKALAWMVALAFALRLAGGVATYLILPVNGYDDADDRAGYVFTDAHRRDQQAWELAGSDQSILSAFDKSFHTDQYGGLLAFSALAYRVFSPDVHRPLLLVLFSSLIAALGVPFLWKAASQLWGEQVALAAGWIFVLYPESILLGGSAMREPYLMTFSSFALWGFVDWRSRAERSDQRERSRSALIWLGLGLTGMLLVSPAVALVTLVILGGWLYFTSERGRFSWWMAASAALIFMAGVFLLSYSLNRQGQFDTASPFGILGGFLREAVKWDVYQLERGSGWVQKLFDEMPAWLRLPFVTVYGIFQPVLPAALVEPTTVTWKIIAILRAAGWYALLPVLVFSFVAAPGAGAEKERKVWRWLGAVCWFWLLLASLRGGGDQWDNPRYRAILFLWQAALAGHAFVWWRATRSVWFVQILACELLFLIVFTQWYASRYLHWGDQLPFGGMVALILSLWGLVLTGGWWWQRRRRA